MNRDEICLMSELSREEKRDEEGSGRLSRRANFVRLLFTFFLPGNEVRSVA